MIYAFAQNGNFSQAAAFAASSDNSQLRTEWLAAAYGSWANYQPGAAAASAMQMTDDATRTDALNAVITTWGSTEPQGLADFAANDLPPGDQRTLALSQALFFWVAQDPVAVANWINSVPSSPELDVGEAAIATHAQAMQQPLVAINWAEMINNPNLRSRTVAAIVETWRLSNSSAALDFARTSDDLSSEDRAALLSQSNQ